MSNSAFSKGGQTNYNNTSVTVVGDETKTITITQANGNSVNTTFSAGSGGGMTDPMTTAGDIVIRNSSNTTSRLGIGTSGQILTVVGGVPSWQNAPSGTSQWNTDTYGINYTAGRIGIGSVSNNYAKLNIEASTNDYYGAQIFSCSLLSDT